MNNLGKIVFVTGATGFIGRHLIQQIIHEGYSIIALCRRPSVIEKYQSDQLKIIKGDLVSGEWIDQIDLGKVDTIIHLASAGVKASDRMWDECVRSNIEGTQQLLYGIGGCRSNNLRIIYVKSFYEDHLETTPLLKKNPYIVTKAAATNLVELWSNDHSECSTIFLKLYQAYGPGDNSGSVLSYVVESLKNGNVAKLGSGNVLRDWIYINDVVDAIVTCFNVKNRHIEYYDIGTGRLICLKDMIMEIAKQLNCNSDMLDFDKSRDRDDIGLRDYAKVMVPGWKPQYSIKKGIEEFIKS